jgi:hypothetical protein
MLLGISDPQVIIGYGLAIGLVLACVVYGWLYWNDNGDGHGS